jgi:hypothetical protein
VLHDQEEDLQVAKAEAPADAIFRDGLGHKKFLYGYNEVGNSVLIGASLLLVPTNRMLLLANAGAGAMGGRT